MPSPCMPTDCGGLTSPAKFCTQFRVYALSPGSTGLRRDTHYGLLKLSAPVPLGQVEAVPAL